MKTYLAIATLACTLLAAAPTATLACGEGQFNMGQGMRYQGYLAPRPATVLVYSDPAAGGDATDRAKLYKGLQMAGHRVTVVSDPGALTEAMSGKHYDVVIADFSQVSAVQAGAGHAMVLPVVARTQRNAPELRSQFPLYLVDGASLGQYLKVINQAVVKLP